ncbi:phospholipase D family protein [Caldimonas sp. KR1-144]|uniref:phospholipase D family protein n=1 Tax=Caldimonas sp. KR1-144 TaxID=3400911 RepID=UPI003C0CE101
MTLRLVDGRWGGELSAALRADPSESRIISPFIKHAALCWLLAERPRATRVITRFNLADFATGVSDIHALRALLDAGAQVRGVRHLHAKLYLFGKSRAVVTSANLTTAALDRNEEFGAVLDSAEDIGSCSAYFERLWSHAGPNLSREQLDDWEATVTKYLARGARPAEGLALPDFGTQLAPDPGPGPALTPTAGPPSRSPLPVAVAEAGHVFVKFLGTANDREALAFDTLAEVKRAGCHWALAYPAKQRPRIVNDGDLMYIARMTREPTDMRIFGRAIGMRHVPGRDDATPEDIAARRYKEKWSRYVRVHHAEFVAGPLSHGVSLRDLMAELGAGAFESTQVRAAKSGAQIDPKSALKRRAAVRLSAAGAAWVASRLQGAFDLHSTIPQSALDALDWPIIP